MMNYTNTNLIISYLIKIELAIDRISKTPIPRSYREELREEIMTEDIEALSSLIGFPIGNDEARRVYQGKTLPSARSKMLVFTNYRNSLEFAKNYDRNNYIAPSSELILHINNISSNKLNEDWISGKFRSLSEKPINVFDSWIKYRDYYPDLSMEAHFDDVMRLFLDRTSRIPFYIRTAIFVYEMIEKAPLLVGNQITTIPVITAMAKDYDKNPHTLIPFAKVFNFIKDDIPKGYKIAKSQKDLTAFIEAYLYSLSIIMLELENMYGKTFEDKVKKHGALKDKFNKRQLKLLDYLEHTNKITREEFAKMMGVSFMTAFRDLKGLLKENYIEQQGVGRGTFYLLPKNSQTTLREEKTEDLEVFSDIP